MAAKSGDHQTIHSIGTGIMGGLTDDYGSCIVPLANVRLLDTVFVLLQKPLRMKQNKSSAGLLYTLPALTILMAIVFIPIMVVVNYSVQDVFSGNFFLWAGPIWFEKTLRSVEFWQTLGRSALYSTLVIAIEIPLGVFIALKIPKSGAAATLYIIVMAIPLLIPWFVVGLIWKIFADPVIGPFGASMSVLTSGYDLNSPLVAWLVILLVDVWHWTGLVVLLSYAGLVAIPETMYQAARIDSASRWAVFRYVELPRLRHVLLIALLLRLTDSLMVYIEPFMITRGGPDQATTFLSMDLIQTAMYQFDFGEASASALIYLLIMLTLSWALYSALMARND
jgi:glycerol transport system permease protein